MQAGAIQAFGLQADGYVFNQKDTPFRGGVHFKFLPQVGLHDCVILTNLGLNSISTSCYRNWCGLVWCVSISMFVGGLLAACLPI